MRAVAGFSVVPKKDPSKQRKLIMMCATSYAWTSDKSREQHGMLGGVALASLHSPIDAWEVRSFDESRAFTSVVTPSWMWAWTCCPPIPVHLVRDILPLHLRDLPGNTFVYPGSKRLAMGGTHSVHILMNINMTAIGRSLIASRRLAAANPNGIPE